MSGKYRHKHSATLQEVHSVADTEKHPDSQARHVTVASNFPSIEIAKRDDHVAIALARLTPYHNEVRQVFLIVTTYTLLNGKRRQGDGTV